MASWYPQIKQFHIFIVIVSVSLFLLRFCRRRRSRDLVEAMNATRRVFLT